MLGWEGWNDNAKSYLKSIESEIPLLDVITSYQEESEDFHNWFTEFVRLYFQDELEKTLERILLVNTFKDSLSDPKETKRYEPTAYGVREKNVVSIPGIPAEYTHSYDSENLLSNNI